VASRATSTFIPEEFEGRKPSVQEVASLLMGSVKARQKMGKSFGLIVVAEGIIDVLDPSSVPEVADCPRDHLGRIRHSEVHISDLLVKHLRALCKAEGLEMAFYTKNLGYELRCADPISFDIEYTTFLGLGAVRLLDEGATGVMVTKEYDRIGSVKLESMIGPDGRMVSRKVDLNSDLYKVARSFMIR
jgi:6-phosphofructokinase 1